MTTHDPHDRDVLLAYLDAAAALQGLTLGPEWRPGILASFETIAAAERLLSSVPLDEIEPAPLFAP